MKKIALIICFLFVLVGCKTDVKNINEKVKEEGTALKDVFSKSKIDLVVSEEDKTYDKDKRFRLDELKADFETFTNALVKMEALSDTGVPEKDEIIKKAEEELSDGMLESEFYSVLQKMSAKFKNSELELSPSIGREQYIITNEKLFSKDVVVSSGKIYLDSKDKEEVLAINGNSSEDIIKSISELVTGLNLREIEYKLSEQFALLYFELYGSADEFKVKMTDGEKTLDAVNNTKVALSLISKEWNREKLVEYEEGTENGFSFGYLSLKTVEKGKEEPFYNELNDALSKLKKKAPWIVVLDMRGNHTSNPEVIKYIYSKFINQGREFYKAASDKVLIGEVDSDLTYKVPRFRIITDASMGSLVNQLIIRLSREPDVETVGVSTSSGTSGFYDAALVTLKNTKIRFVSPTKRGDIEDIERLPEGLKPVKEDENIKYRSMQTKFLETIFGEECNT